MKVPNGEIQSFSVSGRWSQLVLRDGFTAVPNSLLANRGELGISTTGLYVYIVLDSYRWDNWRHPFPSLDRLSEHTGLSKQTVYRATTELQRLGCVYKQQRFSKSNIYDLTPMNEELEYILEQQPEPSKKSSFSDQI